MRKKKISLSKTILSLVLVFSLGKTATVSAVSVAEQIDYVTVMDLDPRYDHISRISASLTMSSIGRANCAGSFTTYEDYNSTMTIVLQQFKNMEWVDVKEWSSDFNGSGVWMMEKGYYVSSGYQYQAVVTVEIFDNNGKILETIACESPIREY